jgi:hypothetical protein
MSDALCSHFSDLLQYSIPLTYLPDEMSTWRDPNTAPDRIIMEPIHIRKTRNAVARTVCLFIFILFNDAFSVTEAMLRRMK